MAQHALIDGFFAFWATMCLWLLWENLRKPNDPLRLTLFAVVSRTHGSHEGKMPSSPTSGYLHCWARIAGCDSAPSRAVCLLVTVAGPLTGLVILIFWCGSAELSSRPTGWFVSKASVASLCDRDRRWPLVSLPGRSSPRESADFPARLGAIFRLKFADKPSLYLLTFVVSTYLLMCNIRYGMNLRYTNMWDMPLRYLALGFVSRYHPFRFAAREIFLAIAVLLLCAIDLRQYCIFFVQHDLV